MKTTLSIVAALMLFAGPIFAKEYVDPLDSEKHTDRSAERGAWTFQSGEARCVADPELYKKFKNHGPIIRWSGDFKEVTAEMEMKATDCQRVVFTLNGEGHVFRTILSGRPAKKGAKPTQSRLIAWAEKSSKENKGTVMKPDGLPNLESIDGQWVKLQLSIKGDTGTLSIGEFETPLDHAALSRDKNSITLSFASGDIALRNVNFITP